MVGEAPEDHAEWPTAFQPRVGQGMDAWIASDEDEVVGGRVDEEHFIAGSFWKAIDGANNLPASLPQSDDDRLTDVIVREQRQADHDYRRRLRYSAPSRSIWAPTRSCSVYSASISAGFCSAYARAR